MLTDSLTNLWYGFEIALQPHNLWWSFVGVLIGNLIGVLPGLGALTAISMLLPITYSMHPVPAVLMLAGIFYGSMYGGAIGAILLNLPSHPPHAVTCLDGYPMARAGRGGTALGVAMFASFFAASFGIVVMIIASPLLVRIAFNFGPAEIFSIMLLGLLAGSTMARGSPLKGVAMTTVGLLLGIVGTDVTSGVQRFTFGFLELSDKIELVALALGLFGVADFLVSINRMHAVTSSNKKMDVGFRDMLPSRTDIKQAFWPTIRGTLVGTVFGAMPGTGPTVASFVAYAFERKVSRKPGRFGHGALEGVAAPEAASHSKTQVDFIPTMSLGIPGDAVMALILGALLIQGVQPGPQMIREHPDIFWGLIASFWIGNVLLMIMNLPMIGIWVRMLKVPYRYLLPLAMGFIAIGVYSTNNSLFEVGEALFFGVVGAVLLALDFPVAPILLGFVLGRPFEENFRRALLLSRGDMMIFVEHPISAVLITLCALLLLAQICFGLRRAVIQRRVSAAARTGQAHQSEPVAQGGAEPISVPAAQTASRRLSDT
ncbi:tripartite tricarboxylate transporter permease [Paraburkholderia sp. MM6662-R1]|uniref:tripartite tricarboxylate transporter permease n=1 Tax=Paraburkholderia sp. MM6662-R1 TaxID=2991066 RepID=UPI003D19C7B9